MNVVKLRICNLIRFKIKTDMNCQCQKSYMKISMNFQLIQLRRNAYDSFMTTFNQYKNTYAATYATEVTKEITMARLRGYDSVIDMLLEPHDVTKEMYENQLNII